MRRMLLVTAVVLASAGCTSPHGPAPPMTTPTAATLPAPVGSAVQAPPCPSMPVSVHEAQGTGHDATLWALFFGPLRRGTEIKVVWRMTGAGDLSMWASGPGGARVSPVWGPQSHLDSTWHKPGQEWGTGWVFPTVGCWTVHATRSGSGSGELALLIR